MGHRAVSLLKSLAVRFLAICFLGCGLSYYLNPRSSVLLIGALLAGWTFVGDYAGYNARSSLGGLRGTMAYAMIYGLFLGSGLGTVFWYVQRSGR